MLMARESLSQPLDSEPDDVMRRSYTSMTHFGGLLAGGEGDAHPQARVVVGGVIQREPKVRPHSQLECVVALSDRSWDSSRENVGGSKRRKKLSITFTDAGPFLCLYWIIIP